MVCAGGGSHRGERRTWSWDRLAFFGFINGHQRNSQLTLGILQRRVRRMVLKSCFEGEKDGKMVPNRQPVRLLAHQRDGFEESY